MKDMKDEILLFALNASFAHHALGVLTLAARVNSGMKNTKSKVCFVLECNINERDDEVFYKLYENAKNKKIVGFSCYIWNIEKMLKFAENLKKLLPDIYVVFGGPEVSFYESGEFLKLYPFADCLIKGEGEIPLLELLELNFKLNLKEPVDLYKNLYDNAEKYHTVYYESSRGCPFGCSYCVSGIYNNKVRAKDIDVILNELKFIEEKYYNCEDSSINIIKFCDRTFNFDVKRANKLYKNLIERAEIYKKIYDKKLLPYQFEVYPSLFDEESFEILKSTPKDLFQMEIGIQSLNSKTLEAIGRKNFDVNKALENIAGIKSLGNIKVHVDLIAGLPYEDLESFRDGFNLLYEKTKADFIQIGFLKFLRGTRIREEAGIYGYIYEESAPYTVLQNDYMSFEDIAFLRDIEKIYKRYTSKAYEKSFDFVYGNNKINIFDILRFVAEYWRENNLFDKPVSQKNAFEAFYKAFESREFFEKSKLEDFINLLERDFYEYEGKKLRLR